ncbi:MAG: hypothetical protein KDC95_04945 [Planctomycetes bacterium]|nr:hypothetical protein [Planctomycetota bacterium]
MSTASTSIAQVNATATEYGVGSPVPGDRRLVLPASIGTITNRILAKGFCLQAPVDFVIDGLHVADPLRDGYQSVAVYVAPSANPVSPTFFAAGINSTNTIACNITVKKGQVVVILGCCSTPSRSSVGRVAAHQTVNLLGYAVNLQGASSNDDFIGKLGVVSYVCSNNDELGDIEVLVRDQGRHNAPTYPTLVTGSRPILGTNATLDVDPAFDSCQGGIVLVSSSRYPQTRTPYGDLLVALPALTSFLIAKSPGSFPISIPSDHRLVGARITLQAFYFDVLSLTFGSTNATEWLLGDR